MNQPWCASKFNPISFYYFSIEQCDNKKGRREKKTTKKIMFITTFYHFCLGCLSASFCGFALILTLIKKFPSPFDLIMFHNFLNHVFAMALMNSLYFIWTRELADAIPDSDITKANNSNSTDIANQADTQLTHGKN